MGSSYYVTPVGPFHSFSGASYNTSVTLTDVSPAPQVTIAGMALGAGSEIEIRAAGSFSTTGTPTLLLGFYYGGVAGVALAASTAITTGSGAASWPWILDYRGVVRTIGTGGSIVGQGRLYIGTSLVATTTRFIPETAGARTVSIDTTSAKAITVGAQWGTSSASNALVCDDISVKLLN